MRPDEGTLEVAPIARTVPLEQYLLRRPQLALNVLIIRSPTSLNPFVSRVKKDSLLYLRPTADLVHPERNLQVTGRAQIVLREHILQEELYVAIVHLVQSQIIDKQDALVAILVNLAMVRSAPTAQ